MNVVPDAVNVNPAGYSAVSNNAQKNGKFRSDL